MVTRTRLHFTLRVRCLSWFSYVRFFPADIFSLLKIRRVHFPKNYTNNVSKGNGKGKAIPLQALTGPEGSRRLRLPNIKTVGT
jgi:hypothetical protein